MNLPTRLLVSLLFVGLLVAGCSLAPTATGLNKATPTFTPAPSSTPLPASKTQVPEPTTASSRLVTLADSDRIITVGLGQNFTMDLGQSPGSDWLVQVSPPGVLNPPVHQLGPQGSPIVFQSLKPGETTIEANSHGICVHPGPCPEVFLNFSLKVRVLAP